VNATLLLEDGRIFRGQGHGFQGEALGEVVFNTSMSGYQEILTDPSYAGQIVTMTYPLIGNTGVNTEDLESRGPRLEAFVVRRMTPHPSNWRMSDSLEDWLREHRIPAISEIDTRALVRHIRKQGAMRAVLSLVDHDPDSLGAKVRESPGMVGRDLASAVTTSRSYEAVAEGMDFLEFSDLSEPDAGPFHIVAYDFGIKTNILRDLTRLGARVTVVPASTSAPDALALNPVGIFLSNGPGDPDAVDYAILSVRELLGKRPVFGICLGHQIMSLAMGGRTYKLPFGHHGGNHPVRNVDTGRIEITAHNHGFAVDADSLPDDQVRFTHLNLNDDTVEGLEHRKFPAFSVQYHPEAAPGPHDSYYLFRKFFEHMRDAKKR
jgi:carbamoyl-phosphate synthase small subunit